MECGGIGKHGFIELMDNGEKVIHEWHDYAEKIIERREDKKMIHAMSRHVTPCHTDVTPMSRI